MNRLLTWGYARLVTPGDVLQQHRERINMTKEDLGRRVGVTAQMIRKYEQNDHVPRRDVALAIDHELGAGGVVSSAFGYLVTPLDDATALRERVAELSSQVAGLLELTAAQGAAIERLERAVRQAAAGSR